MKKKLDKSFNICYYTYMEGKAKHPHNSKRPSPANVKRALAKGDMDALRLALTPRQLAFCNEYVVDFKGKEACIRAGYSAKNAEKQAYCLLMNDGVRTYIEHLQMSTAAKELSINPDWVTSEIVKTYHEAERSGDKFRGLELLSRILGMLKERTEISGPDGEAIQVEQRRIEEDANAMEKLLQHLSEKRTFVITDGQDPLG